MKKSRYLAILLLVLASASASPAQLKSRDEAIELVVDAIHRFHLTTLKDACGAISVIERSSYFDIVVRERHAQGCRGSPETAPRLFTVRARKRDGRLTSDVYDGTSYRPVDHTPGTGKDD